MKLTTGLCSQIHDAGKTIVGECSQGWNHLIWISDKNMCLLPVSIPSPYRWSLSPRKTRTACSTLFWPKIATFLSSLACFIGEEFREGKDAEVSQNTIKPFHWIHFMAENTTAAMSSVRFCRHKDFPPDHNNVFKCLSHKRIVESLFAYHPSLCFTQMKLSPRKWHILTQVSQVFTSRLRPYKPTEFLP